MDSPTPVRDVIARAIDRASIVDSVHTYRLRDQPAWDEAYTRLFDAAADAILLALRVQGYEIVPREPTEEMIEAGIDVAPFTELMFASDAEQLAADRLTLLTIYRAMISASAPRVKDER